MIKLALLLFSLALTACSLDYNPRFYYNNVELANLTGATISDLRIQVGVDGLVFDCAEVTDNRLCQKRFGKRPYPQDVVDIRWRDAEGAQQSLQINPTVPLTLSVGLPIRLIMELNADGSIKSYFRQDDFRFGKIAPVTG